MPDAQSGAQRASTRPRSRTRSVIVAVLAAFLAVGGLAVTAPTTQAAGLKVVIVVGPAHGKTSEYITSGKYYARLARTYGATVKEVYSPYATWSRVSEAARGANVLVYLGHGNGWPSPYYPFSVYSKDGMGLNKSAGAGHRNVKYYGEYYMRRLGLAPDAVVILNRLCYASGNSEWGQANPTKSTAIKRVDNYGAGFLRSGAKAVFADGITSSSYVLRGVLKGSAGLTMKDIFWSSPARTGSYRFSFWSSRTPGRRAIMDPYRPGRYYRSLIGDIFMTAGAVRTP